MSHMRVVIAPDSFKGSAPATAVARAIADGWLEGRPGDDVVLAPMADGGEGTLDAFEIAVPGARRMPIRVTGPTGRPLDTDWLLLPPTTEAPRGTGVVELAATSGLTLLDELAPFEAQTTGFGEAIGAALDHGVSRLYLGIGGSASTDAGMGALTALGARVLDAAGRPVADGNRGLAEAVGVDVSALRPLPPAGVLVLSDVTNPLFGELGAAAVFGPQKGATAGDVQRLDAALVRVASLVAADPDRPGAGAAGGTGFGLLAWGATMAPGADAVGTAIGLPRLARGAGVVITGEGRFDSQSAAGKVPAYVASIARANDASTVLIAGSIAAATDAFAGAHALVDLAGSLEAAVAEPLRWLREAGRLAALAHPSPAQPRP
jgi:glycerate kinase